VQYFIPTIGLRIEFLRSNRELAYSCDSESCSLVLFWVEGADVLIHEASDPLLGHSSAAKVGKAFAQEEVGALYLIHYPTGQCAAGDLLSEARTQFESPVAMAEDFVSSCFD
jgi:ribonuclease BN (tRNA processing enzyme)